MMAVTQRAVEGLEQILSTSEASADSGIKLVPDDRGAVSMVIARPEEGDAVVAGEQRPLLIVDSSLTTPLDHAVLDMSAPGGGEPRFHFRKREDGDVAPAS